MRSAAGAETAARGRGEILFEAADELERGREDLALRLTRETGKVLAESRAEVDEAIFFFEMLEAVGAPDILCFASDYPHWDADDPAFMLKRLPEAWRHKVMHENAANLYGERLGLVAPA
jgi:predicted TIM-barrel fold metal-dependent hydrolase